MIKKNKLLFGMVKKKEPAEIHIRKSYRVQNNSVIFVMSSGKSGRNFSQIF